jgi:peptide/nickel transport system permease protein
MSWKATLLFVLRRLAALVVLLVIISFLVFSLLYISPGSPEQILVGTQTPDPQLMAALRVKYHLDEPLLTQYWIWARGALQLHFGDSIQTTLPVTDEIRARLPTSLFLGIYAFLLTMVFGVGLGICAAFRKGGFVDRFIVGASVVGISAPAFVVGITLLYVFAVVLHWFPAFGAGTWFFDELWHLTLPAIALALGGTAFLVKHTRAAMINVLGQDYLSFARARGLSRSRVLFFYALRNALIPVITVGALILAGVITGALLVEIVFSLPGIGSLLVNAVATKDIPMVQGVTMIVAIVILLANLLADLTYLAVDPRIRLGRRSGA